MATKTSLIIQSKDGNNNLMEKKIPFVNPALTDANADAFSRAFNNLSTNTYVDTIRVDEKSINDALAGD